jgi:hypothetical protein
MDEQPRIVRIVRLPHDLEVLTYEGPDSFRIDSWKVSSSNDPFRDLRQPSDEMKARRFPNLLAVIAAVTRELYLG